MELDNHFGSLVKSIRRQANMTQRTLAELTDLNRAYICMLENGQRYPSLDTVVRVAHALNVKASDLIKEVEEQILSSTFANIISELALASPSRRASI